jgi:hypothetical protein
MNCAGFMHYIIGNPLLYNYDFWRYIWNYIITNPASLVGALVAGWEPNQPERFIALGIWLGVQGLGDVEQMLRDLEVGRDMKGGLQAGSDFVTTAHPFENTASVPASRAMHKSVHITVQ